MLDIPPASLRLIAATVSALTIASASKATAPRVFLLLLVLMLIAPEFERVENLIDTLFCVVVDLSVACLVRQILLSLLVTIVMGQFSTPVSLLQCSFELEGLAQTYKKLVARLDLLELSWR